MSLKKTTTIKSKSLQVNDFDWTMVSKYLKQAIIILFKELNDESVIEKSLQVNCRVVVGWIEYELHQSLVCLVP